MSNFGVALDLLKEGKRVHRAGWNGKGMWIVLIRAGNAMHVSAAGSFDMEDCLGIKMANGRMQPGWKPTTPDLFAEDWDVVA